MAPMKWISFDALRAMLIEFSKARIQQIFRSSSRLSLRALGDRLVQTWGYPGAIRTPEAPRSPPMASRGPRRLLLSTPFKSSSGECRLIRCASAPSRNERAIEEIAASENCRDVGKSGTTLVLFGPPCRTYERTCLGGLGLRDLPSGTGMSKAPM